MKFNRRSKVTLSVIALVVATLLLFQNCADPLELSSQDSLSFNDQLPFAFNTKLDTVAFMSCARVPPGFNKRAYFTFRAGAYRSKSGIKLTDNFLSTMAEFTPASRAQAIADSPANSGSTLQLSVRKPKGSYQSILTNSGSPVSGIDFFNILLPLDTPEIANVLTELQPGQTVRYFPGLSGLDNRRLEGSLFFNDTEKKISDVQTSFQQGGMLALTYAPSPNNEFIARPGEQNSVFGQGMQMTFSPAPGRSNGASRVISNIAEFDLETGQSSGLEVRNWTCGSSLALIIARPGDAHGCIATDDQSSINLASGNSSTQIANNTKRMEQIRSILPIEDWYVDLSRNCVLPKVADSSCYGNTAGMTVIYNPATACSASDDSASKSAYCAHYVSICTRAQ